MESFKIIPAHEWDEAQIIMKKRATREKGKRNTTHGKLLLSGLVFCGTCGSKLTTLACKSKYAKANGKLVNYKFYKYACASLFTPKTDRCKGKNSYLIRVLEPAVIDDIKAFLSTINTAEIVESYIAKLDADARQYIADLGIKQAAIPKAEFELAKLKGEIIRVLTGESTFSEKMIKELLVQKEAELLELRDAEEYLQNEILRIDTLKCSQMALTAELDNWSELFDKHDLARCKAMLYNIIERIDVWRGRVEITYKIRLDAFVGAENSGTNFENDTDKLDFEGKICYNNVIMM